MTRILIWDIPTRLFHWLLAGSFVGAFAIANLVDDDSPAFRVHMLLGLVMAFMVLLRVLWGLVGTRWARFGAAIFGPRALLAFLRGALTGGGPRYAGHNPGAAFALFGVLALVLGLAVTGLMMGGGDESVEDLHEVLAWSLLAVVGVHLAGVAWHSVQHRENLALSMVDGRKEAEPSAAIPSSRPLVGVLFLALTGAWAAGLLSGYDPATSRLALPLVGTTLQLGEDEDEHEGKRDGGREHGGEDEDDD